MRLRNHLLCKRWRNMEDIRPTTLERIHSAAKREFLEKGFLGASLRNIVKCAGVTTGAFYGYYDSKEKLFDALVSEQYEHIMDMYVSTHNSFKELNADEQQANMGKISGDCLEQMIEYMYANEDEFRLILMCSKGTRYENMVHEMSEVEVQATHDFVEVMRKNGCKNIIFSSSATVYGNPAFIPITEECPKGTPTNPYGWTKWMIEQILTDLHTADPEWNVILLRYFNPIGAHKSGLIGEDPKGIPNNLLPYVAQVAIGKLQSVGVFGNDYDTPDGTGVRDYIHVVDLAVGHVKAINKIKENPGVKVYNLGTGNGYSVLDVIKAFSKACGHDVPYVIKERRPGDIATCYSDASLAKKELGWEAQYGIDEMCADSWKWQSMNPNGYND